jgi:hypothetical protein
VELAVLGYAHDEGVLKVVQMEADGGVQSLCTVPIQYYQ